MSLIRQVWLLVLGAVLAAALGAVAVSTDAMRSLMQAQLQLKNSDNAAALALALSQQGGDRELMQLLISAQFDTGHYRSLRWLDAEGKLVFERAMSGAASQAPAWFVALAPIEAGPGVAKLSNGWQAVGSVEVLSHGAYAHDQLWQATLRSLALTLVLAGLAGGLAALVLHRIRRPLDAAVAQAEALVQGSYTQVDEPRVPELQRLARVMNAMVGRVRQSFEAQAEQLQVLARQAHEDALTGLAQRGHFMAELESALQRDDGPAQAGLVLLRLRDLAGLNQRLGRPAVDQLLRTTAELLKAYPQRVKYCLAGRLNGSDLALWLPVPQLAAETADALAEGLRARLPGLGAGIEVALGAVELNRERALGDWFAAADAALARAEHRQGIVVELHREAEHGMVQGERAWQAQIAAALRERRSRLLEFPVLDQRGQVLHWECPLQLELVPGEGFQNAQRWLALAVRSRLSPEVDLQAVGLALDASAADGRQRCVNVAPASLLDGSFVARLRELALQQPQAARLLGLELSESAAIQHFELLQEMGRQLRPLGLKLGLEHAGADLSQVERLYQAGLDYVKLDAGVVLGVAADAGRAAFVRGMVIMLRSLALKVYAEGLGDAMDVQALWDCELDGVTGPWATARQAQTSAQ